MTCTCPETPEHTWVRYGSAVEPGSQYEPNPHCELHGWEEEYEPGQQYHDGEQMWARVDACTCAAAFMVGPGGHESGCGWVMVGDV